MADSKPEKPIDEGVSVEDAAVFYVEGKVYEGFKNLKLERNLTSLTGAFEIVLVDKWKVDQEDFSLKPGLKISCKLGKKNLYTGYIDNLGISLGAGTRNLTIAGRDITGDLVDCSILGSNEFNNMTLDKIAEALVKPFGIKIIIFSDVGKPFTKFTVNQGETIFEALERLSKQRSLLMTSSPSGNLVFEKKGIIRASTELIEGVNIMGGGAQYDNTERFSEYHIKGQNPGLLGSTSDNTKAKGLAKDLGITRYRPKVILAENAANADDSQKRANWEAGFQAAKGTAINVVVQGWTQKKVSYGQ